MYIYERTNWTDFRWDSDGVSILIDEACRKQGRLYGMLGSVGLNDKLRAMTDNLTQDIVYSSEIEGISLNRDEVRSSIARRLGIDNVKYTAPSHYIDSVVAVMMDALNHYDQPISKERLCDWQSGFFPMGVSEGTTIEVGQYRTHEEHIISGVLGREKVHYVAPPPSVVPEEMDKFIEWFNSDEPVSYIIRSAIAHLWFVSIHPFEDGNGRLARILSDVMLSRGDANEFRFYNISTQINRDKKHYYDILERVQHGGDGDITEWIKWYVKTLIAALDEAMRMVRMILNKSIFWLRNASSGLSTRQTTILNMFLDGYEAKITSRNWATLAKCSQDTATRDIQDLVSKNILIEDIPGAKRPSYSIVYDSEDITPFYSDVVVHLEEDGSYALTAIYKGRSQVHERILTLDAQRYLHGELPLRHLLSKYCSYIGA